MSTQRYESLQCGEGPSTSFSVRPTTTSGNSHLVSLDSGWRPSYLRRRVLSIFCFTFAVVLLALELLLGISQTNNGIATGRHSEHYAWTYGPTAFLTILAAAFSRVEYQNKLIAPWARLAKGSPQADKTLLLDYVSPVQLWTVYTSCANRDFAVAASTIVSLLIKILIVLSTGLITLSATRINVNSIPVDVQSKFIDDNAQLLSANSLPYYMMEYSISGNLTYPAGLSKDFAFQSVQPKTSDAAGEIQVTVEALTSSLLWKRVWGISRFNITATSRDCELNTEFEGPSPVGAEDVARPTLLGRLIQGQCAGTSKDDGKRVLVLFAHLNNTDLTSSTQLSCQPTYKIVNVNLVQNASDVHSVSPSPSNWSRTLSHVSPWNIMQAHFDAYENTIVTGDYSSTIDIGQSQVDVDTYTRSLYGSQLDPNADISLLDDENLLEKIATDYYRQFGAIIARTSLMGATSDEALGTGIINENRLFVQDWAVHWMTGLVAASLLLTLLAMAMTPSRSVVPRNPTTFPEMAVLISQSFDLLDTLQDHGDAHKKSLHRALQGLSFQTEATKVTGSGHTSRFEIQETITSTTSDKPNFQQSTSTHPHPWGLHHASRFALCLTLLAIVITLELVLRKSDRENGLGNVGDWVYVHYSWTLLPGLLFGTLSLIFSSIDCTVRAVVPYTMLRDMVETPAFKILDLLDMSVPNAIYREAKLRHVGALATTGTLLIASFFTIISASLYQAVSIESTSPATLLVTNSFPYLDPEPGAFIPDYNNFKEGVQTASMVLVGNQSYPKFTYESIAFPHYLPSSQVSSNSSTVLFNSVIPAIRPRLDCRRYDITSFQTAQWNESSVNYLGINVTEELCDSWYSPDHGQIAILSNVSFFGIGTPQYGIGSCSDFVYIWGQLDQSNEPQLSHAAALGCNQSYDSIDVNVSFVGTDLAIDTQRPPEVLADSAKNSTVSLGFWTMSHTYDHLLHMVSSTNNSLDPFFSLLTTSRWAIPVSMLGDPTKSDVVDAAIRYQSGIVWAQMLNVNRQPANTTNATLGDSPLGVPNGNDARSFAANVTDPNGPVRVVQDATSTRILEALLLMALGLQILSWIYIPRANVLPNRSPTTIANMAALLAGGNVLELLPENAQDLSSSEIEKSLGQRKFWVGWGTRPDVEGLMRGNENENGVSRFGIFAVGPDDDQPVKRRSRLSFIIS
ncbi:hypothetical protein E8E14_001823 [Neopestalotiopsis sp. 37M]|nr:hypothetical protein E8E14_001823 [Neopestalotiopsis sp. 37M]